MKKAFLLILAVVMLAALCGISSFAEEAPAEDLEIDISQLVGSGSNQPREGWPEAGWTNGEWLLQFGNWGDSTNLGPIDLSLYESVTIMYGRDVNHETDPKAGFVFGDKAAQNKDASLAEDIVIYADTADYMFHDIASGTWADYEPDEITIPLNLENYTPGSDVWLSARILLCVEENCVVGANHANIGFAITYIRFNAVGSSEKVTEAPTAAPTDAPTAAPTDAPAEAPTEAPSEETAEATNAPEESGGCGSVIGGGAAMIAVLAGAMLVLKKKSV